MHLKSVICLAHFVRDRLICVRYLFIRDTLISVLFCWHRQRPNFCSVNSAYYVITLCARYTKVDSGHARPLHRFPGNLESKKTRKKDLFCKLFRSYFLFFSFKMADAAEVMSDGSDIEVENALDGEIAENNALDAEQRPQAGDDNWLAVFFSF